MWKVNWFSRRIAVNRSALFGMESQLILGLLSRVEVGLKIGGGAPPQFKLRLYNWRLIHVTVLLLKYLGFQLKNGI